MVLAARSCSGSSSARHRVVQRARAEDHLERRIARPVDVDVRASPTPSRSHRDPVVVAGDAELDARSRAASARIRPSRYVAPLYASVARSSGWPSWSICAERRGGPRPACRRSGRRSAGATATSAVRISPRSDRSTEQNTLIRGRRRDPSRASRSSRMSSSRSVPLRGCRGAVRRRSRVARGRGRRAARGRAGRNLVAERPAVTSPPGSTSPGTRPGTLRRRSAAVLVTTFHPDPAAPGTVAYVAWIDHTRTEIGLYPGLDQPPVASPRGPARSRAGSAGGCSRRSTAASSTRRSAWKTVSPSTGTPMSGSSAVSARWSDTATAASTSIPGTADRPRRRPSSSHGRTCR